MTLQRKADDLFTLAGPVQVVDTNAIAVLSKAALTSRKKRARINLHNTDADPLHEMIIALERDTYVRPHKHPGKSESFHILRGALDVVVFDEDGEITHLVHLSADRDRAPAIYRLSAALYHTLLIRSDQAIIHEVTNGPFRKDGSIWAPFAPSVDDCFESKRYIDMLKRRVDDMAERA